MTLEDFLARLDGKVKRTGGGVIVRCPAHADRSPSLSIAQGDDERILLRCFAGCTVEEITAAMGLSVKDLFPDATRSAGDIRRDRERREAKQLKEEQKRQRKGARMDCLREAERFVCSARDIPDSDAWSNVKRDRLLNQLADAYALLSEESYEQ